MLVGTWPSISTASQATNPTALAAMPKSVTQTRWGRARSSRKTTVSRERRSSSVTTSRIG